MGSVFVTWASPGRTAPPKAVPITATTKDGASKGGVSAGVGSPEQTAASVRRG